MEYYLVHNLFINNGSMYFVDEKNEEVSNEATEATDSTESIIKLDNDNYKQYLSVYGWDCLPKEWELRLTENNFSLDNETISECKFLVLECGAEGDCLFYVLAEALNNRIMLENSDSELYDVSMLRTIAASCINDDNFPIIIESYRLEEDTFDFNGNWSPREIKTKNELKNEIIKKGNNFWGDHIILQLLQELLKFNVIILNDGEIDTTIHGTGSDIYKHDKTIVIYYLGSVHFQLIGYFDGNIIKTCFNRTEVPSILQNIYDYDCNSL